MGKKLDALLGRRGFKTSKLKTLLGLTVSRLGIHKNKCKARCSHTEGDIANLLQHGHHDQALSRAAYVVKERNMLDCFTLVESFCNLIRERAILLEHSKTCPAELDEAISSLIYMATRSGELPELKDIREIFSGRYGETFVRSAMEVRNGCSVSLTIIQKMSTREPSYDDKMRVLKEIAAEKEIPLNPDDFTSPENSAKAAKEELRRSQLIREPVPPDSEQPPHTWYWEEDFSGSGKMREKFKDASSAAEAAFKSAAFAAAAARVAVDLSREGSHGRGGPDDQNSSNNSGPLRRPLEPETPNRANQLGFEKIHPAQSDTTSESQDEDLVQLRAMKESEEPRREANPRPGKEIIYDSSDDDTEEVIQLEHRRSKPANNRDETRHVPQRNIIDDTSSSSSSEEEEEIPRRIEESKPSAPLYANQRPASMKTKEYAPDLTNEETSPSREDNFRSAEGTPRRPPSKFADPRLKWSQPQSPAGQNYSFSVRTRRGGLQ